MIWQTFCQTAVAAFPADYSIAVERAAEALRVHVNADYSCGKPTLDAEVFGKPVSIPVRIHFTGLSLPVADDLDQHSLAIRCLYTRSTDGYMRQAALRSIINSPDPAAIPFVILLVGEYAVEIIDDIVRAIPTLDHDNYTGFLRENVSLMERIKAQATSYWNSYYRRRYPKRSDYPGLMFFDEVEGWGHSSSARVSADRSLQAIEPISPSLSFPRKRESSSSDATGFPLSRE